MATRYWVAGMSGAWNSTTSWSDTSNGASGASVPTAADDVIFDSWSTPVGNTTTVTVPAAYTAVMKSLDCTGAGSAIYWQSGATTSAITISGSAKFGRSDFRLLDYAGTITFNGTGAGQVISGNFENTGELVLSGPAIVSCSTGEYALLSNLRFSYPNDGTAGLTTGTFTLTSGTLRLNGKYIQTHAFITSGSTARTLDFGCNSTNYSAYSLNMNGYIELYDPDLHGATNATPLQGATLTGLTLLHTDPSSNSQYFSTFYQYPIRINLGTGSSYAGASRTYTWGTAGGLEAVTVDLIFSGSAYAGSAAFTATITASSNIRSISTTSYGNQIANTSITIYGSIDVGSAVWVSGANAISFSTTKPNLDSYSSNDARWILDFGPGVFDIPIIFNATGTTTDSVYFPSGPVLHGYDIGATAGYGGGAAGNQLLNTSRTITHNNGYLNVPNGMSVHSYSSNVTTTRKLYGSNISLKGNGTTVWNVNGTGYYFHPGLYISIEQTTAAAVTFNGGAVQYGHVSTGLGLNGSAISNGITVFGGGSSFYSIQNINNVYPTTIRFTSGTTTKINCINGLNGAFGAQLTLDVTSAGTAATILKDGVPYTNQEVDYVTFNYITATPTGVWYVGSNCTQTGSTGITVGPADRYWVGGTATWDATAGTKWSTSEGGAGGASIPTAGSKVYFNNVQTVTISASTSVFSIVATSNLTNFTAAAGVTLTLQGSMQVQSDSQLTNYLGNFNFATTNFKQYVAGPGYILQTYSDPCGIFIYSASSSIAVIKGNVTIAATNSEVNISGSGGMVIKGTLTLTSGDVWSGWGTLYTKLFASSGTSRRSINTSGQALKVGLTQPEIDTTTSVGGTIWNVADATNFGYSTSIDFYGGVTTPILMPQTIEFYTNGVTSTVNHGSTTFPSKASALSEVRVVGNQSVTAATINLNGHYYNLEVSGGTTTTALNVVSSKTIYGTYSLVGGAGGSIGVISASGSTTFATGVGSAVLAADPSTLPSWVGTLTQIKQSGQLTCSENFTLNMVNPVEASSDSIKLSLATDITTTGTFTLTGGKLMMFEDSNILPPRKLTVATFTSSGANTRSIDMSSSGLYLTGTGTAWNHSGSNFTINYNYDTSGIDSTPIGEIVLSNATTTARTFAGGGYAGYGILKISGIGATSTTSITGANTFFTITSDKGVAHTLVLPASTTTTFYKWGLSGTVGNLVTVTSSVASTAGTVALQNNRKTERGTNYLTWSWMNGSAANQWYLGLNSTATSSTNVYTNVNTNYTKYWVNGTGAWNSSNNWSWTSGGASGVAAPDFGDDVVFDTNSDFSSAFVVNIPSSTTAYARTITANTLDSNMQILFADKTSLLNVYGNVDLSDTKITLATASVPDLISHGVLNIIPYNGCNINITNAFNHPINVYVDTHVYASTWPSPTTPVTFTAPLTIQGNFILQRGTVISNYSLEVGCFSTSSVVENHYRELVLGNYPLKIMGKNGNVLMHFSPILSIQSYTGTGKPIQAVYSGTSSYRNIMSASPISISFSGSDTLYFNKSVIENNSIFNTDSYFSDIDFSSFSGTIDNSSRINLAPTSTLTLSSTLTTSGAGQWRCESRLMAKQNFNVNTNGNTFGTNYLILTNINLILDAHDLKAAGMELYGSAIDMPQNKKIVTTGGIGAYNSTIRLLNGNWTGSPIKCAHMTTTELGSEAWNSVPSILEITGTITNGYAIECTNASNTVSLGGPAVTALSNIVNLGVTISGSGSILAGNTLELKNVTDANFTWPTINETNYIHYNWLTQVPDSKTLSISNAPAEFSSYDINVGRFTIDNGSRTVNYKSLTATGAIESSVTAYTLTSGSISSANNLVIAISTNGTGTITGNVISAGTTSNTLTLNSYGTLNVSGYASSGGSIITNGNNETNVITISGNITASNNITIASSKLKSSTGNISATGYISLNGQGIVEATLGNISGTNLSMSGSPTGAAAIIAGGNATFSSTSSSSLQTSTGVSSIGGSLSFGGVLGFTCNSGSLTVGGTLTVGVAGGSALTINSGTLSVTGVLSCNALNIYGGKLELKSSSTVAAWTYTGGTFDLASNVAFTCGNISISGSNTKTAVIRSGATITSTGTSISITAPWAKSTVGTGDNTIVLTSNSAKTIVGSGAPTSTTWATYPKIYVASTAGTVSLSSRIRDLEFSDAFFGTFSVSGGTYFCGNLKLSNGTSLSLSVGASIYFENWNAMVSADHPTPEDSTLITRGKSWTNATNIYMNSTYSTTTSATNAFIKLGDAFNASSATAIFANTNLDFNNNTLTASSATFNSPSVGYWRKIKGTGSLVLTYDLTAITITAAQTGAYDECDLSNVTIDARHTNTASISPTLTFTNNAVQSTTTYGVSFLTSGTYSWTVPDGITEISAVAIGGGGAGGSIYSTYYRGGGGGGGALHYNTFSVTPGEVLTINVGAGGSGYAQPGGTSSITRSGTYLVRAGGGNGGTNASSGNYGSGGSGGATYFSSLGGGGGAGGSGGSGAYAANTGGGGAGGYSGNGGNGGSGTFTAGSGGGGAGGNSAVTGGGTGIYGQGASGTTSGASGSIDQGDSNSYGKGAANGSASGVQGAVRIAWTGNGTTRQYPTTSVSVASTIVVGNPTKASLTVRGTAHDYTVSLATTFSSMSFNKLTNLRTRPTKLTLPASKTINVDDWQFNGMSLRDAGIEPYPTAGTFGVSYKSDVGAHVLVSGSTGTILNKTGNGNNILKYVALNSLTLTGNWQGGQATAANYANVTFASPEKMGWFNILTTGTSTTIPSTWNNSNNSVYLIGGGGSGGLSHYNSSTGLAKGGNGGGGGGFSHIQNFVATPSSTVTYVIGSGGPPNGSNGSATTWNSGTYIAGGGTAGTNTAVGIGGTGNGYNGGVGFNGGNGGASYLGASYYGSNATAWRGAGGGAAGSMWAAGRDGQNVGSSGTGTATQGGAVGGRALTVGEGSKMPNCFSNAISQGASGTAGIDFFGLGGAGGGGQGAITTSGTSTPNYGAGGGGGLHAASVTTNYSGGPGSGGAIMLTWNVPVDIIDTAFFLSL